MRGDDQGAEGGVLAQKRALRTFGQFDVIKVGEVQPGEPRVGVKDVVDNDADAGFGPVAIGVAADASNGQGRDARVLLDGVEVGQLRRIVLHPIEVLAFQLRAADRRNRDRHILKVFGAVAGGDDHLFHGAAIGSRVAGGGVSRPRRRESRERQGGRRQ